MMLCAPLQPILRRNVDFVSVCDGLSSPKPGHDENLTECAGFQMRHVAYSYESSRRGFVYAFVALATSVDYHRAMPLAICKFTSCAGSRPSTLPISRGIVFSTPPFSHRSLEVMSIVKTLHCRDRGYILRPRIYPKRSRRRITSEQRSRFYSPCFLPEVDLDLRPSDLCSTASGFAVLVLQLLLDRSAGFNAPNAARCCLFGLVGAADRYPGISCCKSGEAGSTIASATAGGPPSMGGGPGMSAGLAPTTFATAAA
jgi:hypothetical protein